MSEHDMSSADVLEPHVIAEMLFKNRATFDRAKKDIQPYVQRVVEGKVHNLFFVHKAALVASKAPIEAVTSSITSKSRQKKGKTSHSYSTQSIRSIAETSTIASQPTVSDTTVQGDEGHASMAIDKLLEPPEEIPTLDSVKPSHLTQGLRQ
ncbi:hypothetical protein Clacol_004544 [Clathrus columnatus]|uniref:Uncharacterized protein n=1 Tax=Clathrus columnatus TaxID=1419009 RepID=A0AAV5ACE6_9AGAM|nr:hypothetical protein Clacol_004544 [Clathrus columnatus]